MIEELIKRNPNNDSWFYRNLSKKRSKKSGKRLFVSQIHKRIKK